MHFLYRNFGYAMLAIIFFLSGQTLVLASDFKQALDIQLRADDRSNETNRYQYRMRYYPQFMFDDNWSINSFIVTGNEFGSSHNTIDDGQADYFYIRRLYLRHQGNYGKTEIGIVPTYKGRVSSSGLSKDGWIKGIRYVTKIGENNLEIVVGELSTLNPSKALRIADEINYLEIEYSAVIDRNWSYEISAERITDGNFVRGELRNQITSKTTLFVELIQRLDDSNLKTVFGVEGKIATKYKPVEYFAHYSYVSDNFGLRAELTEDFLGTGHGIGGELAGKIGDSQFDWFFKFEAIENNSRFQVGIKWSL